MRTKFLMMLFAGSLLVAGCSSTHDLTAADQSVRFTGTQSNWFSGHNGENSAMCGAANDFEEPRARPQWAATLSTAPPSPVSKKETYLASFVPLDNKIQGQVYTQLT